MFRIRFSRCVVVLVSLTALGFSQSPNDPNNLLKNGSFDNGITGWVFQAVHGSKGAGAVADGQMVCQITQFGTNKYFYDVQFLQNDLTIVNGVTYVITFDAKAAEDRTIVVNVENQATFGQQQYSQDASGKDFEPKLTTTMQTFSHTFTMSKPTDNKVRLNFNVSASLATVTLDNISLIDKSKMTAVKLHPRSTVNVQRIVAGPRGLSFNVADPTHFGFRIVSPSGRVVANSNSSNPGAVCRIDYRSLGISAGTYVAQVVDGTQQYSTIFSVVP
jgi:hypothetical protein